MINQELNFNKYRYLQGYYKVSINWDIRNYKIIETTDKRINKIRLKL